MGVRRSYLGCLNLLAMGVGLVIGFTGVYILLQGNQSLPAQLGFSEWQAMIAIIMGASIFGLSLVGCLCESCLDYRIFIYFFAFIQFVVGIIIIVAGTAVVVASGQYINAIVDAPTATRGIDPGIGGLQQDMSDFLLGLFHGCCNGTDPALQECPDFEVYGDASYCYLQEDVFEAGVEQGSMFPEGYCAEVGVPDVCSSDIPKFLLQNQSILNVYFWPAGLVLIILGVLLVLACCCSWSLGRSIAKKNHSHQHSPAEEYLAGPSGAKNQIVFA